MKINYKNNVNKKAIEESVLCANSIEVSKESTSVSIFHVYS
jgi:hypothetical protein